VAYRQSLLSLCHDQPEFGLGNFAPKDLKILEIADFTPKFEYYVDLVWSRETELGAAARFLIQHLREKRLNV